MGWGCFFLRAEALGAEQPVEADASVRARDKGDGMECPGKGRRGGGHGADALGTVAFYGVNGRFGRDGLFG